MSTTSLAPNKKTVQRLIELKPLARKYAENPKEAAEYNLLVTKEYSRGVSLSELSEQLGYTSDITLRNRLQNAGTYEKAMKKHKASRKKTRGNKQPARVSLQKEIDFSEQLPSAGKGLVTMEVSFIVNDPAKLIGAWLSTPYAKETLLSEPDYAINWAQCILDLMTLGFDEASIGAEFESSICGRNPISL